MNVARLLIQKSDRRGECDANNERQEKIGQGGRSGNCPRCRSDSLGVRLFRRRWQGDRRRGCRRPLGGSRGRGKAPIPDHKRNTLTMHPTVAQSAAHRTDLIGHKTGRRGQEKIERKLKREKGTKNDISQHAETDTRRSANHCRRAHSGNERSRLARHGLSNGRRMARPGERAREDSRDCSVMR